MPFIHTSQPRPHAPEGRVLPIVLDEAHVVLREVEAHRGERTQVEVEDVGGEGFRTTWYW
jgi:hypothetical protein